MNRRIKWCLLVVFLASNVYGQEVVSNKFKDNWYVEMGFDMSLQNPYGYDFSNVFPNGKTFGIDVAAGKWFTPVMGCKIGLNWENGIKLLENGHANWLAPFYQPGENMRKGGYVAFFGDLMINLHNLFGEYRKDRTWNAVFHPRTGAVYNCGANDGSPIIGLGLENSYRLSSKWSVLLDIAYNFVSGAVAEPGTTGVGSGSNGFFNIQLGACVDLGKRDFDKASVLESGRPVVNGSFWSNWFMQAAVDMSLQNPYGCNFSNVFPNGKSFGIDVAVGKWFTPEVAVRGKLNWENGIIENKDITWVPPANNPRSNYQGGGYAVLTGEMLFNLTTIIKGYDENRKWQLSFYPKAGLIKHFGIGSGSPLVGVGIENSYRLNDRLSLYADVDYQVTTSESSVNSTGANSGSNGFFRIETGIQVDLGKSCGKFQKKL